jgi:hypothetical protein
MNHIEKLLKYQEKIRELHQLSQESGVKTDIACFDHVDIELPEGTVIMTFCYNDENCVTDRQTFPLSMIEHFTYLAEEKIKYRRKIIEQLKEKEEGK